MQKNVCQMKEERYAVSFFWRRNTVATRTTFELIYSKLRVYLYFGNLLKIQCDLEFSIRQIHTNF